jgi:SAM-dependent methyltransferase
MVQQGCALLREHGISILKCKKQVFCFAYSTPFSMQQPNPRCPVCNFPGTHNVPFHYEFNARRLQGFRCRSCGIIFINPQPSPDEIALLYSAEYFESGDFRCGHERSAFAPGPRDHLVNAATLAEIRRLRPSGAFLEVGCAAGAFLNAVRNEGYEVTGVELSQEASERARSDYGLNVIQGDLLQANFPDGSFDVVYMGDVLEHLPDPLRTAREVHRILRPGGVLAVEVPAQTNTLFSRLGFAVYRVAGRSATVHLPPYHLFEYRPRSLCSLLNHAGFAVAHLKQTCIAPGKINLRGRVMEKLGKKVLQYPNYALTRLLHRCGDRMAVYAVRGPSV